MQADIAHSVVKELRTTLLGEEAGSEASGRARAEVAQAARGRGTDPEVHQMYLLGAEALAEAMREPDDAWREWALAIVQHAAGRRVESDKALRELVAKGDDYAYRIAEVHASRGDADTAFQWLERALSLRDNGLTETKVDFLLRSLHGDPRWGALLGKIGF